MIFDQDRGFVEETPPFSVCGPQGIQGTDIEGGKPACTDTDRRSLQPDTYAQKTFDSDAAAQGTIQGLLKKTR